MKCTAKDVRDMIDFSDCPHGFSYGGFGECQCTSCIEYDNRNLTQIAESLSLDGLPSSFLVVQKKENGSKWEDTYWSAENFNRRDVIPCLTASEAKIALQDAQETFTKDKYPHVKYRIRAKV